MILKEYNSPSKVYDEISEEKLGTWDRDAIAFYYHPDYGFIAKPKGIHQRILRALALSIMGYEDEADYDRQLKQANSNSEFFRMDDELKYTVRELNNDGAVMGRYWCERGVISFWDGIPDLQTFKIIVKKLHVSFDEIRIALEEEIMLAKDVYQSKSICDGNGIPFDAEMQADAKALHLMNASDKAQTDQMQNYLHNRAENQGKKLQYQNKTEEMPMAQWRALHSTSESTIYNNMIITEKLTYEEKYNLSVKLIKQGYLIHCTNAEYDKFDKSYIKGGSRAMEGYGMYFSDMPYKSIEYGDNFKLIKKEDFNFLDSSHPIDKNMLFNEDVKHELSRLYIELDDCCNSAEYDSIKGEIEKLESIIENTDKDFDMLLDIVILRKNPKTYAQLDAVLPNREQNIEKLLQRYIDKGYDGYYTDGIYTVFNFDKLNEHVINYNLNNVNENIQLEVLPNEVDLSSFKKKSELNTDIWLNENTLNSRVRLQLLDIADDFFESLEVSFVEPKDIILTGSICNYNWSKQSDIDVHIVIDFGEIDANRELVEDYFNTKKNEWNKNHKGLQIFGFNVEMYVEDVNAERVSNGIYSLESNKWISKPDKSEVKSIKPHKQELRYLSSRLMTCIDDLMEEFHNAETDSQLEDIQDTLDFIWDFIKAMRKQSLKKEGEYSKGNIIYKILRRNGYLEEILQLRNDIYDKLNSIS